MQDVLSLRLAPRPADFLQQQRGDQELHQDVAHAVEAETLAGLVADDERNLERQPRAGRCAWRDGGGQRQSGHAENRPYRTGAHPPAAIARPGVPDAGTERMRLADLALA
ncbi:hypothetical protein XAUB_26420 [Xanthomonas citri pv. aurantifolii str. ICPB 11122]|nr:hypothetical protein XAUB_26420 [Xanthomonas citri pv. aurantifolii str. ICPB 11122]